MLSGLPSARAFPRDMTCHLPNSAVRLAPAFRDCARSGSAKPVWLARSMWQTCPCLQGPYRGKKGPRHPAGAVRPVQNALIPTYLVTAEQHSAGKKQWHIKLSRLK